jgi:protein gp37
MGVSNIEWTDAVWNPVTGCTPCAIGCQNCYARRMAQRLRGRFGYPADEPFHITLHPERLEEPLHWKKPRRVFVCSMGDLFHEDVPEAFLDRVWGAMIGASQHTYMVLTKRPERMAQFTTGEDLDHIWLGASCSTQADVDANAPYLLRCRAAVPFLSLEPLLGPIKLNLATQCDRNCSGPCAFQRKLNWVIVGGESGPGARPCDLTWIRSIVQQCQAARVPCFVKQLGTRARISYYEEDDSFRERILDGSHTILQPTNGGYVEWDHATFGQPHPLAIIERNPRSKGSDPSEWPEDLRVREYPFVAVPATAKH